MKLSEIINEAKWELHQEGKNLVEEMLNNGEFVEVMLSEELKETLLNIHHVGKYGNESEFELERIYELYEEYNEEN